MPKKDFWKVMKRMQQRTKTIQTIFQGKKELPVCLHSLSDKETAHNIAFICFRSVTVSSTY